MGRWSSAKVSRTWRALPCVNQYDNSAENNISKECAAWFVKNMKGTEVVCRSDWSVRTNKWNRYLCSVGHHFELGIQHCSSWVIMRNWSNQYFAYQSLQAMPIAFDGWMISCGVKCTPCTKVLNNVSGVSTAHTLLCCQNMISVAKPYFGRSKDTDYA